LTSISTIFTPSSTSKLYKISYEVYVLPSKDFSVVGDRDKGGELRVFQQLIDMI